MANATKPIKSLLDPAFRYRPSFDTDVGRHLREHQRAQRLAGKRSAPEAPSAVVRSLAKRSVKC